MSEGFELECFIRTDLGKGASRRLRRINSNIPAILYGGNKAPVSLSIAHKDIAKATESEVFFSQVITLNINNKKEPAVIKALQRHPARPLILHADFQRVSMDKEILVQVPIHYLNEDECVGVKLGGGNIIKSLNEIEVSCLPKDLPEYIEVDMLDIELGGSIHLSDITLPEEVISVALSHGEESDLTVASVQAPRGVAEEEEEAVTEVEGEEGEEGESEEEASKSEEADSDDSGGDGEK